MLRPGHAQAGSALDKHSDALAVAPHGPLRSSAPQEHSAYTPPSSSCRARSRCCAFAASTWGSARRKNRGGHSTASNTTAVRGTLGSSRGARCWCLLLELPSVSGWGSALGTCTEPETAAEAAASVGVGACAGASSAVAPVAGACTALGAGHAAPPAAGAATSAAGAGVDAAEELSAGAGCARAAACNTGSGREDGACASAAACSAGHARPSSV